mgnify:CR=1 FL=1
MGSRGFGVGQVQSDGRCRSEETELNAARQERSPSHDGARENEPEATVNHTISAGVDAVYCGVRLDTCGNGVSGRRFSRHSRFLASRRTPVDSGLQR